MRCSNWSRCEKCPTATLQGVVQLGVIESMQPVVLPNTMQTLLERYPGLELRPSRGRSSALTAAVKAGELDAVTGTLAARFVNTHVREKRGHLEIDSTPAIVAMVSAGLGISVVQIAAPGLLNMYPVRIVRLGRNAPVLQLSLVTRQADDDSRPMAAVRDAMLSALMNAEQRRSR